MPDKPEPENLKVNLKVNLNQAKSNFTSKLLSPRLWIIVFGVIFCAVVIHNSGFLTPKESEDFGTERGRVLSADNANLLPDPQVEGQLSGLQILTVEILTGPHKGQVVEYVENKLSSLFNNLAEEGMTMLFNVRVDNGTISLLTMFGYERDAVVYILIGAFMLLLLIIGRRKGLYSAIALIFTMITVIFFMIPFILDGRSPILMAILTSVITSVFTIFLVGNISLKSAASIAGIVLGVAAAGIVGVIAGGAAHVSGLNIGDTSALMYLSRDIPLKLPEILFAGIIISTLGAVMDVSMSISSAVFEVKEVNPNLTMRDLWNSGMNIGKDIMGTMSNTLILAFAGSSMNVLIILILYNLPYIALINLSLFVVELIQGIAGSIGLVLAVPITAFCAAALASRTKKAV